MQDPLHSSGSKRSRKLLIDQVERVQDERHAKFGSKARVKLEKSAAKRKAVSVDLPGSDSIYIFVFKKIRSRVGRGLPVEQHTQLVCIWTADGV